MPPVKRLLLAFVLLVAACGDASIDTTATTASASTTFTVEDPSNDCRFSFAEGSTQCGPGADITSVQVDPTGPIVLTIELTDEPFFNTDFQWLVEFSINELACGLTNSEPTATGFSGTDTVGSYGYRTLTNEDAPPDACGGELNGSTATLVFNIRRPVGPWAVLGGTQQVETDNLDDPGSSDDVVIDGPST